MGGQRRGRVGGAARGDVSWAEAASLKRGLRRIGAVFLVLSIAFLSLALALFLERRVARPVAGLVGGMQRAETGALGARVAFQGRGGVAVLGRRLKPRVSALGGRRAGVERPRRR